MANDVDQLVQIEWPQAGVAMLRLNRPDRLNALSPGMVAEIPEALTTVANDRECRVIILTGAGRGFCAGLDLQETTSAPDGFGRGPGRMLEGQERFASMIKTLRTLRQPVIAAVNGAAAGAGFALALGSDIRIAAQSARFHVAAVKLGLSGGECGMSYLLPRQIGSARALELLLTGRPFDAVEAERIGLVARVVPDDELIAAALEMAAAIVANSPLAIWLTKQVVWSNLDASSFESAIELENRTQVLASMSRDSAEAMRAFVEKRPAVFTGE